MNPTPRTLLRLLLTAAVVSSFALSLVAADSNSAPKSKSPPRKPDDPSTVTSNQLIDDGLRLYVTTEFDQAIDKFVASYNAKANAFAAYMLANCYVKVADPRAPRPAAKDALAALEFARTAANVRPLTSDQVAIANGIRQWAQAVVNGNNVARPQTVPTARRGIRGAAEEN